MKSKKILMAILIATVYSIYFCGKNPEKVLENSIISYKNGNEKSLEIIGTNLIRIISKNKTLISKFITNSNVYFKQENEVVNIFFQGTITLKLPVNKKISHSDINDRYIILSDFNDIFIFNREGSYIKTVTRADKTALIKDTILFGNKIIYYLNDILYQFNINNEKHEILLNENFRTPYSKIYRVKLFISGNILCVAEGIAGVYLLNIVNLKTNSIIEKNISISSLKLFLDNNKILYFKGSTGNWALVKYDIGKKTPDNVLKFNDLIDVEVTKNGLIIENSTGNYIVDYDGRKTKIPFQYKLLAKYKDVLLIEYKGYHYFSNIADLFIRVKAIYQRIPGLFEDKN